MQNEEIDEESAQRNTEVEIPSVVVATTLKVEKKENEEMQTQIESISKIIEHMDILTCKKTTFLKKQQLHETLSNISQFE